MSRCVNNVSKYFTKRPRHTLSSFLSLYKSLFSRFDEQVENRSTKKKKKRKKRKKDRKGGNKWTANSSANSELLGYRDTGLTAGSFRAETACLRAETYRRATCELVYPIGFLAALCRFSVHASRPMTHARIRLPHRSCICVSLTGRRNECRVRATADCNRLWSPSVFCGLGQCHALAAAS